MNPGFAPVTKAADDVAREVVDAAMKVHKALGPGLLESVYETRLCHELSKRGIKYARQAPVTISYDDIQIDAALRIDVLAEDIVVVELKAVEQLHPLHEAQLLTYLKLSNKRLGLLINFNCILLKQGLKRMVL